MEKIRWVGRLTIKNMREFYCDECGKYLGESGETYDGEYFKYGEYIQRVKTRRNYSMILRKCLCMNCADKLDSEFFKTLINLGFEKEK